MFSESAQQVNELVQPLKIQPVNEFTANGIQDLIQEPIRKQSNTAHNTPRQVHWANKPKFPDVLNNSAQEDVVSINNSAVQQNSVKKLRITNQVAKAMKAMVLNQISNKPPTSTAQKQSETRAYQPVIGPKKSKFAKNQSSSQLTTTIKRDTQIPTVICDRQYSSSSSALSCLSKGSKSQQSNSKQMINQSTLTQQLQQLYVKVSTKTLNLIASLEQKFERLFNQDTLQSQVNNQFNAQREHLNKFQKLIAAQIDEQQLKNQEVFKIILPLQDLKIQVDMQAQIVAQSAQKIESEIFDIRKILELTSALPEFYKNTKIQIDTFKSELKNVPPIDTLTQIRQQFEQILKEDSQFKFETRMEWQKRFDGLSNSVQILENNLDQFDKIQQDNADTQKQLKQIQQQQIEIVRTYVSQDEFKSSVLKLGSRCFTLETDFELLSSHLKQTEYIIARQDEVLTDKAQKHSLNTLQYQFDQLQQSYADLNTKQEVLFHQNAQFEQQLNKTISQTTHNTQIVDKIYLKSDQQLKQLVAVQKEVNSKEEKKQEVPFDSIKQKVEQLHTNVFNALVVLLESIGLHQFRADETTQCRQNRVTQLLSQVQAVINSQFATTSMQNSKLQSMKRIDSPGKASVPLLNQTHGGFPISQRRLQTSRKKTTSDTNSKNYKNSSNELMCQQVIYSESTLKRRYETEEAQETPEFQQIPYIFQNRNKIQDSKKLIHSQSSSRSLKPLR